MSNDEVGMRGAIVPEDLTSAYKDISPDIVKVPAPPIGSGSGAVYCYYFPYIRKLKEGRGNGRWPCKIGMTTVDVKQRIAQQLKQTGVFEAPEAIVFLSDDPGTLERAFHKRLSHRKINDQGIGTEWFETNLKEVRRTYFKILYPKWYQLFQRLLAGRNSNS